MRSSVRDYLQRQPPCVGRQLCHSVSRTLCQREIPADGWEIFRLVGGRCNISDFFTGASPLILSHWLHRWLWSQSDRFGTRIVEIKRLWCIRREKPPWITEIFMLTMRSIWHLCQRKHIYQSNKLCRLVLFNLKKSASYYILLVSVLFSVTTAKSNVQTHYSAAQASLSVWILLGFVHMRWE